MDMLPASAEETKRVHGKDPGFWAFMGQKPKSHKKPYLPPGLYQDQTVESWKPYLPEIEDPATAAEKAAQAESDIESSKERDRPNTPPPGQKKADDAELAFLKEAIGKYEKKSDDVDLSALAGLVDSWTGSKLLASYNRPETDEERQKMTMNLKAKLAEREGELAFRREQLGLNNKRFLRSQEKHNADMRYIKAKTADLQGKDKGTYNKAKRAVDSAKKTARSDNKFTLLKLATLETETDAEALDAKSRANQLHNDISSLTIQYLNNPEKSKGRTFDKMYSDILNSRINALTPAE